MRPLVPPEPIARSGLAMPAQSRTERRFSRQSNRAQNRRSALPAGGMPVRSRRCRTADRAEATRTERAHRMSADENRQARHIGTSGATSASSERPTLIDGRDEGRVPLLPDKGSRVRVPSSASCIRTPGRQNGEKRRSPRPRATRDAAERGRRERPDGRHTRTDSPTTRRETQSSGRWETIEPDDDIVYRCRRLGPLHQRQPGPSRSLVRHHDRFRGNCLLGHLSLWCIDGRVSLTDERG
jgi:hypothetical protein